MRSRLQRLIELEEKIDASLHQFYYANEPALEAAKKFVRPNMKREAWRELFAQKRRIQPKPAEKLLAPAIRTFKGPVIAAADAHPSARFKGQYKNHLMPLLEVDRRKLGTGEGHAKVGRTMGFTTTRQAFVSRGEAKSLAKKAGHRLDDPKAPWRQRAWKGLHSSDVQWD